MLLNWILLFSSSKDNWSKNPSYEASILISLVLPIPKEPKPLEVSSASRSPEIFESWLFSLMGIIESGTLLTREKLINGTTPLLDANKI